jgi:hypothetical protein
MPDTAIAERAAVEVTPAPVQPSQALSAEQYEVERHLRIERAAYFLAEQRGFAEGDPLQDWLAAERQIAQEEGAATN